LAWDFAGGGVDDGDVEVLDEDGDGGSGVGPLDADVVELAGVAEGDFAGLVDLVVADPVVGVGGAVPRWAGFRDGLVTGGRGLAVGQGLVGPASSPWRANSPRSRTIRATVASSVAFGEERGRRERGSNAASPSSRQRAISFDAQPFDAPYLAAASDKDRPWTVTAVMISFALDTI
jgi:hypothetical protein